MQSPILGAANVARSVNAADNRCVNIFAEAVQEGQTAAFFNRAPGLRHLQDIGMGPIRGLWAHQTHGDDFYVASGNEFYKVTGLTATPLLLGTITGDGPVSIADNGTQLFIACNPDGFIYNEATDVFAQITDPDFAGAVTVAYLDGYFVFNQPDSEIVWVTSLLDGTSVDPLDFASVEASPDLMVALASVHRELWMFGSNSIEVWYDAGNADFPLAPIQGAFNEIGCVAAFSVAKLDNSVWWLGQDDRGQGIVYRSQGYAAKRVSTHSVEWQIQQYSTLTDAVAYTYQQDGHAFYVLNFPTANTTWVFDVATGLWHERAGFVNGSFTRQRANCQCNFKGTIIVGDYQDGSIYALDMTNYADDDRPQKWLRSWRALAPGTNNLKRTAQHSLQLNLETGVGLNSGQGSDPQVMLRWSDDGGHTWSREHWTTVGKIGEYGKRAIWRRLGMTQKLRDRVYEISGTDPVKISIMGAELLLDGTNA